MAQIALPRQQVTQTQQSAGIGSPLYQRRGASNAGPIELIPNPEFVFPHRRPDEAPSQSAAPSNALPMPLPSYPGGRRGSTPGSRQKSISALPDFSFNPAVASASTTASTLATPPHSPSTSTTPTTPSRPIGHRRGGSEFIGGDGRAGNMSLLSSSPTKGEGILPPPGGALRPGPPAGRRGHAHRRSGAISSHDLSSIMNPVQSATNPRAGSAPVTPMEGEPFAFGHSVNKSVSQPSLRDSSFFPDDSSPRRPPSRARVGFSDKIEYIRPLSTISSETETSLSTIRGHSAAGSISSVLSAGTSSPQSGRASRPSLTLSLDNDSRPSTAGAVLDKHRSVNFGSDLFSRKRPMSAISPTVASPISPRVPAKRRGFFRLENRRSDTAVPTIPTSLSDPQLSSPPATPLRSPVPDVEDGNADNCNQSKPASRKAHKKPRKVKHWANSFISRRGKHGSKPNSKPKGRPSSSPPETEVDAEDTDVSEDMDFDLSFDVDNTVTIVSPAEGSSSQIKISTDIASWKPRELKRVDSDTMSPVIDLDAALGPFNTPQGPNQRSQQRGFAAHRRAMHSAGALMQSHRRTESAPALVPFELRGSAAANNSTMADVFEEEEPEDDATNCKATKHDPPCSLGAEDVVDEESEDPKIQVVESDSANTGSAIKWDFDDGLRIRRGERPQRRQLSVPLSPNEIAKTAPAPKEDVSPVEVVEAYEEPRTSSLTHSSDSTVTPQMTGNEGKDPLPVMSLSLPLPQQTLMTPDTFTSSFSSPDFRSSQASLDTPRLGTSASSITDYHALPSPHFSGEPGPRFSTEVPSLTSSRSTATNAFPPPSYRVAGDRSASLCSIPSELEFRRRKRSSIASLSRLINGSSFGERSKLSIEQRPQSEYLEPAKEAKKKHKRLSKLMQFWKPKDASKAQA